MKSSVRTTAPVILFISVLFGCASVSTIEPPALESAVQSKDYFATYDKVFASAVKAASEMNWPVTSADRATGIIATEIPSSLLYSGEPVSIHLVRSTATSIQVSFASNGQDPSFNSETNQTSVLRFYDRLDHLLLD